MLVGYSFKQSRQKQVYHVKYENKIEPLAYTITHWPRRPTIEPESETELRQGMMADAA